VNLQEVRRFSGIKLDKTVMDGEATDMWNKSVVAYFKSHSVFS
jgi:hypothetical protein